MKDQSRNFKSEKYLFNEYFRDDWLTQCKGSNTKVANKKRISNKINVGKDKNNLRLDHNVYWLSTTQDQLGVDTTILQQADYHALNDLPHTNIIVHYSFSDQGSAKKLIAKIENNTDHISFFNRLIVKTQQNASIVPIYWSDNFITIFPHQSETITAHFDKGILQGEVPLFTIQGINSTFEMYSSR
jgi:hypothetical protein